MDYKEFTCTFCGKKGVDRSLNHCRKFCSSKCREAHYRSQGRDTIVHKTRSCVYNKEVSCEMPRCGRCGWNPKVEQKRKEAFAYG